MQDKWREKTCMFLIIIIIISADKSSIDMPIGEILDRLSHHCLKRSQIFNIIQKKKKKTYPQKVIHPERLEEEY